MRASVVAPLAAALLLIHAGARAAVFEVPAGVATIQLAIAAASVSPDADNFIYLTASPIYTADPIVIGPAFSSTRRLVFRPKPGPTLQRVEILNSDPGREMLTLTGCEAVTIQNLDFIRYVTNLSTLASMSTCTDVTFERCRVGLATPSLGGPGLTMVEILYPTRLVIQNCMFFSTLAGNFETDLHLAPFGDPSNALFLYNNDWSDYSKRGLRCDPSIVDSALLVVRNNVAANPPGIAPEPVAFSSGIGLNTRVLTSFNAAFASAANAEVLDPASQTISGAGAADFLQLAASAAEEDAAFVTRVWDETPGALNSSFYHLVPNGGLHFPASAYGVNLLAASPAPPDRALLDDIDDQTRPSAGSIAHTDRGADQVDPAVASVDDGMDPGRALWAAPVRNPARSLELDYRCAPAGRLVCEVFDGAGRRLWREARDVGESSTGRFAPAVLEARGLVFYRLRLTAPGAATRTLAGRAVVLR